MRGFAGGMLADDPVTNLLRYGLSGSNDPFGSHVMLDRNRVSTWLNRQLIYDHGGFRSLSNARFDKYLVTAGVDFQLPQKWIRFIYLFGNAGVGNSFDLGGPQFYYDAGFRFAFLKDAISINFPLVGVGYANGTPTNFKSFAQAITFSFELPDLMDFLGFRL